MSPAPKRGLSDRQIALRRAGVGASEVAAVCGKHPSIRPIDVYAEKRGEAPPFEGNEFTEWGQRLERVVAEAWQDRHPDRSIFTPGTLRHREHSFALASPDRIVVPPRRRSRDAWESVLEIKNVSTFRAGDFGEEGTDEVPEHMLIQVQWQLEVVGLERATLVPLIGGHGYREYPIRRDREVGALLLEAVGRFWVEHVLAGVPPAVDGSDSYAAFLRRRFPHEEGDLLEPTDELADLVSALRGFRQEARDSEARAELAAQRVKERIGSALGVAGLCTWKANRPSTVVDYEAALLRVRNHVALRAPDLVPLFEEALAAHTTTAPGARVLRLVKEK